MPTRRSTLLLFPALVAAAGCVEVGPEFPGTCDASVRRARCLATSPVELSDIRLQGDGSVEVLSAEMAEDRAVVVLAPRDEPALQARITFEVVGAAPVLPPLGPARLEWELAPALGEGQDVDWVRLLVDDEPVLAAGNTTAVDARQADGPYWSVLSGGENSDCQPEIRNASAGPAHFRLSTDDGPVDLQEGDYACVQLDDRPWVFVAGHASEVTFDVGEGCADCTLAPGQHTRLGGAAVLYRRQYLSAPSGGTR